MMDKDLLDNYLKMMAGDNEGDAIMGLRAAQSLFRDAGVTLEAALSFAADNVDKFVVTAAAPVAQAAAPASAPVSAGASGDECHVPRAGVLEINGQSYALPGAAAADAVAILMGLKDAIAAARLSKSRFKLKLLDIKNASGDIVETALQAEYDREGLSPVRVWVNARGEVGVLAAVLRKAVTASLPDLAG